MMNSKSTLAAVLAASMLFSGQTQIVLAEEPSDLTYQPAPSDVIEEVETDPALPEPPEYDGNVLDTAEKEAIIPPVSDEETAVRTITVEGINGSVNGTTRYTITAKEGEWIDLASISLDAANGFEFDKWVDSKSNDLALVDGKYQVGSADATLRATFIGKVITITFTISDPDGAHFVPSTNTSYKNLTYVDDYTVKFEQRYARNTKINFPVPTIHEGYYTKSASLSRSHWLKNEDPETFSWTSFTLKPEDDQSYFTFVPVPYNSLSPDFYTKDEDGNDVRLTSANIYYQQPKELAEVLKYALSQKGYVIPEELAGATVHYDKGNTIEVRNAAGEVVATGVAPAGKSTKRVYLDLDPVMYNVNLTVGDHTTTDSVRFKKDYTLDLNALTLSENKEIDQVFVDGELVEPDENNQIVLPAVTSDHSIVVNLKNIKATSTITFSRPSHGRLDGKLAEFKYTDVVEGTEIAVPVPTPLDGYEFKGWKNEKGEYVELGEFVIADQENHTYTPDFVGKTITITWRVSDPDGAALKLPGGSAGKNMTLHEDGSVTWTGRYNDAPKVSVSFPSVTVNAGYENISSASDTMSHWTHGDDASRVPSSKFTLQPDQDGDYFTLVVMPKSNRYYNIYFVNEAGEPIYTTYTKVLYQQSNEVLSEYAAKKLDEKGYMAESDVTGWAVRYNKANLLEIVDEQGNVLQTGTPNASNKNNYDFTVKVVRSRFTITVEGLPEVPEPQVINRNETYTLDLNTLEGPEDELLYSILVDGEEVWPDENGILRIENVTDDHTITLITIPAALNVHIAYTNNNEAVHQKDIAVNWAEPYGVTLDEDHEALAEKGYGYLEAESYLVYDGKDHISIVDAEGNTLKELGTGTVLLAAAEDAGLSLEVPVRKLYTISHKAPETVSISYETYEEMLHPAATAQGYNAAEGHKHTIKVLPAEGYVLGTITINGVPYEVVREGTIIELTGNGENVLVEAAALKKVTADFGDTTIEGAEGDEITAPEGPAKDGYEFAGWKAKDGTIVKAGEKLTLGTDDLSFIATYKKKDEKKDDQKKPANTALITGVIPYATAALASAAGMLELRRRNRR